MPRVSHPSPSIAPAYTGRLSTAPIPSLRLPDEPMDPQAAYRFIHDELMLDGSSRLNLATFVTTWMDPEAEKLMAETFDKNMIDKDEYPATAAIEQRCVCMVADLFHAENLRDDDPDSAVGVSTIGSSEAVMLGGLALKWRWKQRVGDGWRTRTPNLVLGSNVQVVWEKFCRYFEVEPRYIPMAEDRYVITPEQVLDAVDEDTIGVVAILGTTYTGELEPIAQICAALDRLARCPEGRTCRSTSTRPAAASSCRSSIRTSNGTSGCPASRRSMSAATSSGSLTRASGSWCGATATACPRIWCSGSTTSAATCRRSR